jgi:hypothetical protein
MLFQHPHIRHDHAAVDRLAHVVHRQQADLNCSECFHLDAGLADGFHLRPAMDAVGCFSLENPSCPTGWDRIGTGFYLSMYSLRPNSSEGNCTRFPV